MGITRAPPLTLSPQTSSLQLSAALLRAILVNHVAHSEATRMAKNVEANLRERLEDAQNEKEKLEAELRSIVSGTRFPRISVALTRIYRDLNTRRRRKRLKPSVPSSTARRSSPPPRAWAFRPRRPRVPYPRA